MADSSNKKLYRAGRGHILGGVCAGVADYFNVDVNLVRILWLVFSLINGIGIVAYVIGLLLIPKNPEHEKLPPEEQKRSPNAGLFIGVALVVIGLSFGFHTWFNLYWWDFPWFYWNINWHLVWPLLLIVFGAWFIYQSMTKEPNNESTASSRKFQRSRTKRMIGGVCGGLSEYWNVDVTLVRVAYVLGTVFTAIWLGVIAYVIMLIVVPEEPPAEAAQEAKPKAPKKPTATRKRKSSPSKEKEEGGSDA